MSPTRRGFLIGLAIAVAGAGAAWTGRRGLRRWLALASPGGDPPGPLWPSTAATLGASVRTLLEDRIDPGHYVDAFRWRAEHRPGARALYERFEQAVDAAARRAGSPGFRSAPWAVRAQILSPLRPARGWRRAVRLVLAREQERYARHVVRQVFRRFARTDAWVLSGYGSWPGMPRAIASLDPVERFR